MIAPVFHPVWTDVRLHGHDEYWLKGGRGSTKSSFISLAITTGLVKDPQANAIIYRKVAATLRESVYEQMVWAIDTLGLRPWFRFRLSPMEIRYKGGQRILFRGADDPSKSKSIKLARGYFKYLWFEELSEFGGMDDVRTIKASVLRGGEGAVTFYSYNPPVSARNWVNREALAARAGRLVHNSCYLDVDPAWLGPDFIAEANALRATNERAWRHMYLGEATGTGLNVFENVTLREVTDEEIKTFGHTYAGLDWGWYPDPLHFARCAYDARTRVLTVYDEYRTSKTGNRDVYNYLTAKKGLTRGEEVIADSAEQKSISDMRAYGMRCVGASKGPGSVRASMRWLQALARIVIDPARCPCAAKEFAEYEYEKDREGQPVDAYPDRDNHAIDAVRYAMNREWLRGGA